jgi:tRNA-Thr(GGU) m(6)t(6)A37 methyltransferase TsaA
MEELKFVGKVHSSLKRIEECPRQESEGAPQATIEIFAQYAEASRDLRPGDRIILFTWLHASNRDTLTTIPRNDPRNPMTGVFSTRSPDRPNPIGIHFVEIVSIPSHESIHVSGLEVLDQTPVIDIKPDIL